MKKITVNDRALCSDPSVPACRQPWILAAGLQKGDPVLNIVV